MTVFVPMKLHHKINLQSRVESSRGAMGGIVESWTTADTVWANVRPITGNERINAAQVVGSSTHLVRMRYNRIVTPKMRIQHDIVASYDKYAAAGTPWKTVTEPGAGLFTSDMARNMWFTVTAGTNWTKGDYQIVTYNGVSSIALAAAVAGQDVTEGTGYVSRLLEVDSVISVGEEDVVTECLCTEKTS